MDRAESRSLLRHGYDLRVAGGVEDGALHFQPRRSSMEFTRLPLWARAMRPCVVHHYRLAILSPLPPVVP